MNKEREKDSKDEPSADDHDDSSPNESENESDSTDSSDSDSDYVCTVCSKKFSGALPLRQHLKGSKHKKILARKKKEKKLLNKDDDEEEDENEQIVPEPYKICKTCDKEFSGLESYQDHLKSKAHKQKALHASILEKAKGEDGELNVDKLRDLYLSKKASSRRASDVPGNCEEEHAPSSKTDEDDLDEHDKKEYECKDCDKIFCGHVPFAQHLMSKTHAKQVQSKNLLAKITSENVKEQTDVSCLTVEDDILVCKSCSMAFSGPHNAMAHLKSQKHKKTLEKYLRKLEKRKEKAAKAKESDSELARNEDNEAPEGTDATVNLKLFSETRC